MKLKKLVLLTAITAALGSVNLFASFADEVEEEALQVGWVEVSAGNWQYFDTAGNRVVSKWIPAEEGDGRGNQVWFYVDGSGIGDIGNIVLRDRRVLSEEGLVVVVATIDMQKREILAGPDLLSRGFIYMRESGELIKQGRKRVYRTIRQTLKNEKVTEAMLRENIIAELQTFLFEQTERHPMILPMFVTV